MSEAEFEHYLSLLTRFLRLKPGQREQIADELRDHFEARLHELLAEGASRDDAVRIALAEFGDAAELSHHFAQIAVRRKRRTLMRYTFATAVGLTAAILLATAFWPANQGIPVPTSATAGEKESPDDLQFAMTRGISAHAGNGELDSATEAKLDKQVEKTSFSDIPLRQFLQSTSEFAGVDILVNEQSINDEEGVTGDEPVNFTLKHTPVSVATQLRMILEKLRLAYRIQDGIVIVESQASASGHTKTRIYNCRDLLQAYSRQDISTEPDVGAIQHANVTDATAKAGTAAPSAGPVAPLEHSQAGSDPAAKLIDVLTSYADGNWEAAQGEGGCIVEYGGLLIVTNNDEGHKGVQRMLAVLRELALKNRRARKRSDA